MKLNKQILFTTVAVHIAILLLIGGGLNALGAAFVLSIPFIGGTALLAYQCGKESRQVCKKALKESVPPIYFFRG